MDFSLTEEQRLLQDEIAKGLGRISPLERVREAAAKPHELAADVWAGVRSLGIPGLMIDAEHGGLGLGVLDAALVAEQMGRFAVPAPFVGSAVMAPLAISLGGSPQQQASYLPRLADGSLVAAVGISECAAGGRKGAGLTLRNGKLSGSALFVVDPVGADIFIVADRIGGLHVIERGARGLDVVMLDAVDRTRPLCRLDCDNVVAETLPTGSSQVVARMRDAARVVLAADTLGAAWHMLGQAVDYAGQRRQFGRVIGSFQAVKHMCAEMAAELEPGRALIWYTAYAQDRGLDDAALMAAHAKAYLSDAGRVVARRSVEVHGGIGITDELGLHFWFKRIGWNHQLLGAPERLREEAARMQDESAFLEDDAARESAA